MKFSTSEPFTKCFFGDEEKDGWIELRPLTMEKAREISKKTTTKKFEYKRGQRFEIEQINEKLRSQLTFDYCIGEWSNVLDDSGGEYPNNIEKKIELMEKSVAFSSFVAEHLERLGEQALLHAENVEKNFESSPEQPPSGR